MKIISRIIDRYPFVKNKYFYTAFFLLLWLAFFDKSNLIQQYQDWKLLDEAEKEKEYYQKEIINVQQKLNALLTDNKSLEKFAREEHLMKKENEDIWLVVDTSASKIKEE